ncbi:CRISPR-associated protein Cas5 family [Caldalkalibacillus thermarum TA2.A1]|uniref:CRISPR-associated protein Cas5 family n=1 Tax=Caldalkalibacillus thermarum (strain TA2.A1) TaxID=986075 RepID=F5L3W1_CALTT|nr:type I-B CRISPR-associated protein Cas5b [Caldalkalibacillus thermarum]EGL83971.1 CRISPR-associated protein Cas5 family [Caldalkalibacillus thermarum TA2.A1]QZT34742.1 type I-B CRISPR-associated protein Cas5b [Caldalkalibacillus thermarum TA2.A1]
MRALRLRLFQETACYKKPFAYKVSETYPLPPYSTVKGMLHAVLEATEYIPMLLSIQGKYDTIVTDYQTHYFFKKDKTAEFPITLDGLALERNYTDITTMPIYMHLLYNVQLLIHVYAEEYVLKQLIKGFETQTTYLSLGRWEDLVRIDECELVELQLLKEGEERELAWNAFVPDYLLDDLTYMPYRLNWKYDVVHNVRIWEKVEAGYVQAGQTIEADEDPIYIDQDGELVFFHAKNLT